MSPRLYQATAAGSASPHDLNVLADEALRALDEVSTGVALESYLGACAGGSALISSPTCSPTG